MERILIVEDDAPMLRGLKDHFAGNGFEVATACTGPAGIDLAASFHPNLILLDLMLPLQDGFEVCRAIRQADPDVAILILTARDEEPDIVRGLKFGADGYVTKPFGMRELTARVEALLRRGRRERPQKLTFHHLQFDIESRRLTDRTGTDIKLSPREFALLSYLVTNPGRALSREELMRRVWGAESEASPRTVDRFVTVLRGKLAGNGEPGEFIETIREFGYRFVAPIQSSTD